MSSAVAPAAARLARWRVPAGIGALVVLIALSTALLAPRATHDKLSPTSVSPDGSRALAQVLAREGVSVRLVRRFQDATSAVGGGAGPATLLVTGPSLLAPSRLRALRTLDADLVLLAPDAVVLEQLAPTLRAVGTAMAGNRTASCAAADPVAAGTALAGGSLYERAGGDDAAPPRICYPAGEGGGSYAEITPKASVTRHRVIVLGQSALLTNRRIAADGNAALALRTLGRQPSLVWYIPDPVDAGASDSRPLTSLVPPWVLPGAAILLLAVAVAAGWQGRRLGRLVAEPLPVVVRAVETVEGRAHLYARAGARARAAQALRGATMQRLRALLRLPPTATTDDIAQAAAWAAAVPAADIRALLLPAEPVEETGLVRLAADLDALETQVRSRGS